MIYRRIFCFFLIACFFGYQSAYAADPQPLDLSKPVNPNSGKSNPKILDLEAYPRLPNSKLRDRISSTSLHYTSKVDSEQAYKYHYDLLKAERWIELPGTKHAAELGAWQSTFERDGYRLRVRINKDSTNPEEAEIELKQLGNIPPNTIPKLNDAKCIREEYFSILYSTEKSVKNALAETHQLLITDGWKFYYEKSNEHPIYKKGRMLLEVYSTDSLVEEMKTGIGYVLVMVPEDIPLPAASDLLNNPIHSPVLMQFTHPGTTAELANFYLTELPKMGWKLTAENSNRKNKLGTEYIFRNAANDLIRVEVFTSPRQEKKTTARVEYQSLRRVTELELRDKKIQDFKSQSIP